MKKGTTVVLLAVTLVLGLLRVTSAQERSDFALLNQPDGDTSVQCGAGQNKKKPIAFTYFVTMANFGLNGFVEVEYANGDSVQYPILAGGSFSFSQAAGGKFGIDDLIRVTGTGGASLVGSLSLLTHQNAKPHSDLAPNFCTTSH
jgi:hypothetical protein